MKISCSPEKLKKKSKKSSYKESVTTIKFKNYIYINLKRNLCIINYYKNYTDTHMDKHTLKKQFRQTLHIYKTYSLGQDNNLRNY